MKPDEDGRMGGVEVRSLSTTVRLGCLGRLLKEERGGFLGQSLSQETRDSFVDAK